MSTKATVHHVPYTAESASVTPRTTAEERTKWRFIAQRDYYICREVEPEDSWRNRVFWRTLGTEGRQQAGQDTREEIRSQPDYDGPPMRAPSGLVVRFPAVEGIDEAERAARRELRTHLRAQGYGLVYLDDDRHDGMRAYRRFGVQMLFDPPAQGGRGWCPKLAGVQS